MKRFTLLTVTALALVGSIAQAQPRSLTESVLMPDNRLDLLDDPSRPANITEDQFNAIIDRAVNIYMPLAELQGAKIRSKKYWTSSTVNASADRQGNDWWVSFYGGLARRPEISLDGFALAICHELGHHFGGFPFYKNDPWAANEGQSDYYAAEACSRMLWAKDLTENATAAEKVEKAPKESCDKAWAGRADQELCYRITTGAKTLAAVLAHGSMIGFDTPDPKKVMTTFDGHPAGQCRLDTYFQAALCGSKFDFTVIPGLKTPEGMASPEAEMDAGKYSCMAADMTMGKRPACWYHAR